MKIGHVIVSNFVGGAEREVVDHSAAMQRYYGISVVVIIDAANKELASLLGKLGIPTEAADFKLQRLEGVAETSPKNIVQVLAQARTLQALQKRHAFDMVVTHSFHSATIAAIARLLGMRAKLIVRQLTRRDLTRCGLPEHLQFFGADAVTYNSDNLRRTYEPVARLYRRPYKIFYSYVEKPVLDENGSERNRLTARFGLGAGTTIVGYFGRIFEYKRVVDLIEAVALLNGSGRGDFFLAIVGSSSVKPDYEMKVRALAAARCPDRHCFFEFTSNPFAMMAACDVLVLPSIEPFGRVLVEAMHLGVPFVATNEAGPKEIMALAEPRSGELVPAMRPDRIAEAIVHLTQQRPTEPPVVPYALTCEGIVGESVRFYEQVLAGASPRDDEMTHGAGAIAVEQTPQSRRRPTASRLRPFSGRQGEAEALAVEERKEA